MMSEDDPEVLEYVEHVLQKCRDRLESEKTDNATSVKENTEKSVKSIESREEVAGSGEIDEDVYDMP